MKRKLYFTTVVWGELYVENFLKICLPSQLCPSNLEALSTAFDVTYVIFTTNQFETEIAEHWAFETLSTICDAQVRSFEAVIDADIYAAVNSFHAIAVSEASGTHDWLIFNTPDMIWSSNSFCSLRDLLMDRDPDLLVVTTIRSEQSGIKKEIIESEGFAEREAINLPPRELVKLNFKHLHPRAQLLKWGPRAESADWPHHIYVMAQGSVEVKDRPANAAVVGFHSHPLAIRMTPGLTMSDSTLDAEFLNRVCSSMDKILVVDDSDVMHGCEMSHREKVCWGANIGALDINNIWGWAEHHASNIHRQIFQTIVRVHSEDWDGEEFEKAIFTANFVKREILTRLDIAVEDLIQDQAHILNARVDRLLLTKYTMADARDFKFEIAKTLHAAVNQSIKGGAFENNNEYASYLARRLSVAVDNAIGSKKEKRSAKIITAVWGREYAETYVLIAMPSLLSPNNLPSFSELFELEINLITNVESREIISNSEPFKRLKELAQVKFISLPEEVGGDKYFMAQQSHENLINDSVAKKQAFLIISPDVVFSDGTFDHIAQLAIQGKQVVSMCSVRLHKRKFIEQFDVYSEKIGPAAVITSRNLAALARKTLHPFTKTLDANAAKISSWCHDLYFFADDEYFLVRGFHYVPVFIQPDIAPQKTSATFDIALPLMSNPDRSSWHVIDDSDLGMMCELSDSGAMAGGRRVNGPVEALQVAMFAEKHANIAHLTNFENPVRMHSRDLTSDDYTTDPSKTLTNSVKSILNLSWKALLAKAAREPGYFDLLSARVFHHLFSVKNGLEEKNKVPAWIKRVIEKNDKAVDYSDVWRASGRKKLNLLTRAVQLAKEEFVPKETSPLIKIQPYCADQKTIFFPIPVWGQKHVEIFKEICLPSMAAEGNLLDLVKARHCRLKIYTTEDQVYSITQSPAFLKLQAWLNIEVDCVDDLIEADDPSKNWENATTIYRKAVFEASKADNAVMLICPDFVIANDSFSHLLKRVTGGAKIIMQTCPRISCEQFLPLARSRYAFSMEQLSDKMVTVSGLSKSALTSLASDFLHPITELSMHSNDSNTPGLSQLAWRLTDQSFLIHNFHWHPIYFEPSIDDSNFVGTIDNGLIQQIARRCSKSEIGVIGDSEESCIFELSHIDKKPALIAEKLSSSSLAVDWGKVNADDFHRRMFPIGSFFRGESSEKAPQLKKIEKEVQKILKSI